MNAPSIMNQIPIIIENAKVVRTPVTLPIDPAVELTVFVTTLLT